MFVCKLDCSECDYQSEPFIDGYDLHSAESTFICQDSETHKIRFLNLKNSEVPIETLTDDEIESLVPINPSEVIIRSQFGEEEILNIQCPLCGRENLLKKLIGIN